MECDSRVIVIMDDEVLIALVEQCPHLYNRSLKEFKDEQKRQNSWASIAQHLNTNAETASKRWDNLRDKFVRAYREFSAQPPSGSAGEAKNIPKFPFFKMMLWLAPFIRKRKLTSSFKCSSTGEDKADLTLPGIEDVEASTLKKFQIETQFNEPQFEVEVIDKEGNLENEHSLDTFEVGDEVLSPASSSTPMFSLREESNEILSPPPSMTPKNPPQTYKNKLQVHESMAKAINQFTKVMEEKKMSGVSQGDVHFMKSVVEDMQILPPAKRIRFKKDILDLLVKYIEEP